MTSTTAKSYIIIELVVSAIIPRLSGLVYKMFTNYTRMKLTLYEWLRGVNKKPRISIGGFHVTS